MNFLSVIITTYNRNEQAKRAIKSVLAQTYQPDDIMVIEDGSNSGIKDWICNNYPDTIHYIKHAQNKGLAAARNTGWRNSDHEWITYLDDDNEWLPNRLEETVSDLESIANSELEKLACIQVGTISYDKEGNVQRTHLPINNGNLEQSIKNEGAFTLQSSFFFNKLALEKVGGFDENLVSGIDHDIWMTLATGGYETRALKKPLVIIHQDNIETMMSNTNKRIKGITQYVDKWTPVFVKWFGVKSGRIYAKRYFARVIGRLVLNNLTMKRYKQAYKALLSIHNFANWQPIILLEVWIRIFKYLVIRAINKSTR